MSASPAAISVNNLPLGGAQSEIAKRHANRDIPPQLACAGLVNATTSSRELVRIAARGHQSGRIIACQTQNRRARAQRPPRARPFTGMFGCSFRQRRQHASSSARATTCVVSIRIRGGFT
jgi:hypothetical protein